MKILEILFFLFLLQLALIHGSNDNERKTYIVYMGDLPKIKTSTLMKVHHGLLSTAIGDERIARESMIYSYRRSFNAVAARLLPEEVKKLSDMEGVVSVFPNRVHKLHTTKSWDFLGFPTTARRNFHGESNVVVGMFDTGIWPSSASFNDTGFGPPPSKWKGKCVKGGNFTGCNNKIVGARYYRLGRTPPYSDEVSPIDMDGHGTHTSSTVTGVHVHSASLHGLGKGTARGGVPSARIAMYKVCWAGEGCAEANILAAFDDAISDGVDIISISIGGSLMNYFNDPIAIGSFHAMRNGIFTSCSAGNDGPMMGSVVNVAPWAITTGASGTDRRFVTKFRLGSGRKLTGVSINTFSPKKRMYPLIRGEDAANSSTIAYGFASSCDYNTLDMNKVRGKVVYCLDGIGGQDETVKASGGVGTLIQSLTTLDAAYSFVLPAASVTMSTADIITNYINSTRKPQAVIYKSIAVNISAPFIAGFSSRGPNGLSSKILKPDIAAPGIDILAAYSRLGTVTGSPNDDRTTYFNIVSGTSMACPHVSATAAYIKSFHPDWSPAAIKSAIITTTKQMSPKKNKEAEFAYGAGQVNPAKSIHPGLIYDMDEFSYISFLCKEGYNGSALALIMGGGKGNCSYYPSAPGYDGLNYPTIQYQVPYGEYRVSATFHRTVTNVGTAKTVYKATVQSPKGLSVTVVPDTLTFVKLHQKKSFKVIIKGDLHGMNMLLSAELTWHDPAHSVRSPIVVYQQY